MDSDSRGRFATIKLLGDVNKLGQRRDLHLRHHVRAVGFDRAYRSPQFSGDLFVELACDHASEHGKLACGQGTKT